jgi:hypothetical protein
MQSPPPPPPPSGGMTPPPPPPGGYMQQPMGMAPAGAYGGFWIRVVAYIIDAVILGVVYGIIDAIFRVNPSDTTSGAYSAASGLNLVAVVYP